MAKNSVKFGIAYAVGKRLEEVCEKLPEGMCQYIGEGLHSDESIAAELQVSESTVRTLRTQVFGKLRLKSKPVEDSSAEVAALKEQIKKFEAVVAVLSRDIVARAEWEKDMIDRFNRLIDNLAMNRIIQGKHLKLDAKNGFNGISLVSTTEAPPVIRP